MAERFQVGDKFVTKHEHQLIPSGATVKVTKIEDLPNQYYWLWVKQIDTDIRFSCLERDAIILVKDGEENDV